VSESTSLFAISSITDHHSVDDNEKLREKVGDALNVYNEYLKSSQSGETNASEATGPEESTNEGPSEDIKP